MIGDLGMREDAPVQITVLAGGVGGARFVRGLRAHLRAVDDAARITVIGNTGDDIWVHGVRVCPDLDTVMYTLGGAISEERGWGRDGETFAVKAELDAYGVEPTWFGLGDRDLAAHLVRTQALNAGFSLTDVTRALCDRWQPGVTLLPMSDDRAETHVVIDDPSGSCNADGTPQQIAIHFQEWWIKHRASLPAHRFVIVGIDDARPAPGVVEAITDADIVLLPPSNPVVSVGTILAVPGIADAVRATAAPVVGLSPIIGGAPLRGMADACLEAIDVQTSADGVALHYGSRTTGGVLDGWLVDEADADLVPTIEAAGIRARAVPLYMRDADTTAAMAAAALDLAMSVRA